MNLYICSESEIAFNKEQYTTKKAHFHANFHANRPLYFWPPLEWFFILCVISDN